jgi:hypothetical protein
MNTEERRLSELLHRVTPEPPRGVTVEDVASRLAGQAGHREPRRRRGRAWAPVLAAASVFVVAGVSAGIAVMTTSDHSPSPQAGATPSSASASPVPSSASPSRTASSTSAYPPPSSIPAGPWAAELIAHRTLDPDSLVSGDNSVYAAGAGALDRIDPATGTITATAPLGSLPTDPPLVAGNTVWLVSYYGGGRVVLHGYDAQTLAQVTSVTVPAIGQVSPAASGVLASGPDGRLYLAAGDTVAVLDPATNQVIRRIYLTAGPASSVAVSPDGSKLYVGTASSSSSPFRLLIFDLANGTEVGASSINTGGAGNLVATSGGVWGTAGVGMSEWAWFAPDGDLSRSVRAGGGGGGGLYSIPTLSGGTVWISGSRTLVCASPATGAPLSTARVPTDHNITENFGSIAMVGGHVYAYYQNPQAQQFGLARMTPPPACTGAGS